MQLILLEKIENLGVLGDKVSVKSGYARNYLLPQGKAKVATEANIAEFEAIRSELEQKAADAFTVAQGRARALQDLDITITAKTGGEGKLFGSVGTVDIVEAINATGTAEVSKKEVRLPEGNLREAGEFDIMLHLHSDLDVVIKLTIVPEE